MKYIFTNLLGTFIFENDQLKDQIEFKNLEDYRNKAKFEEKLAKKYKKVSPPEGLALEFILNFFKDTPYLAPLAEKNLFFTRA